MDSESKDTANWHKAEDRGPDGLADWRGRAACGYKEKKEGQVFITLNEGGGVRKEVLERGIMKRAAVREMTRHGFHCQQLSHVKPSYFFFTACCHRTRRALRSLLNYAWRRYVKTRTYVNKNQERTKTLPHQGNVGNHLSGGRIKRKAAVSFLFPNF